MKKLVHLLKLPNELNPDSYQIRQIKKGSSIQVTQICKVPLSIETYHKLKVIFDLVYKLKLLKQVVENIDYKKFYAKITNVRSVLTIFAL